jgi:hypothetical protein
MRLRAVGLIPESAEESGRRCASQRGAIEPKIGQLQPSWSRAGQRTTTDIFRIPL